PRIVAIGLVICALAAFCSGLRQGGVAALLSLAGVLIGGYLGLQAVGPVVRLIQDEGTEGSAWSSRCSPWPAAWWSATSWAPALASESGTISARASSTGRIPPWAPWSPS